MSDTLSIYVAASSDERERAKKWVDKLKLYPSVFRITSKWIETIEGEQHGVGNPRDASDANRRRWALDNLRQVSAADVVWFLVPAHSPGRGGYYEAGWMHGETRDAARLIFSGDTKQSVFCALGREFATDEEAFKFICNEMGLDGG